MAVAKTVVEKVSIEEAAPEKKVLKKSFFEKLKENKPAMIGGATVAIVLVVFLIAYIVNQK